MIRTPRGRVLLALLGALAAPALGAILVIATGSSVPWRILAPSLAWVDRHTGHSPPLFLLPAGVVANALLWWFVLIVVIETLAPRKARNEAIDNPTDWPSQQQAHRLGLILAGAHLAIAGFLLFCVFAGLGPRGDILPFEALLVLDLPVSILSLVATYVPWENPYVVFLVVHGLLGTVWYYFLPRLVLRKPGAIGDR